MSAKLLHVHSPKPPLLLVGTHCCVALPSMVVTIWQAYVVLSVGLGQSLTSAHGTPQNAPLAPKFTHCALGEPTWPQVALERHGSHRVCHLGTQTSAWLVGLTS